MSEANHNAEAAAEIKFRDDLIEAETKLRAHVIRDAATGTLTLPAGVIFENAPEGITEASYEAHKKFMDLQSNALTKLGSEEAVELFKDNKDLQQVTFHAPIHKKDAYEGVFKRQGQSRNVRTGEVSNYVGSIGVGRINVVSSRTQAEWTAIKNNMKALAESAGL
jgi:hypothetical protein